ncbi:MAG TPA: hypothetical protein DIT13_09520 [Verrucomicrobiales bacterium]|nr:hypothetical protein [Verrucomicrobiales bacterium]
MVSASYHISRGEKQLGPCSLDDLRTMLAYGSVKKTDMVRRGDAGDWLPLDRLEELQQEESEDSADPRQRRRTVRYREYHKVPQDSRAGVVLKRLALGFIFFPPMLWRGAVTVFQSRVVTRRTNENGYLEVWPRWVEGAVSAMIVVNALGWWVMLSWAGREAAPMVRAIAGTMSVGFDVLREWLGS